MILLIQQVRSEMGAYQTVFAVALIIIGAGLICVSLIWRRQAETEQPEPDDAGELRTFVDSLRRADETEANLRPRIDRLRNEESLKQYVPPPSGGSLVAKLVADDWTVETARKLALGQWALGFDGGARPSLFARSVARRR